MNLHKHQLYLIEQHSETFNILSAIIRINTEGKSLNMRLGHGDGASRVLLKITLAALTYVLVLAAWNIHDFGLGHIECHYWCAPSSRATACLYALFCRCRMMQTLWISFWDEGGGGHKGEVSFGFEHSWTKADGWCMVTTGCLSCVMKTL